MAIEQPQWPSATEEEEKKAFKEKLKTINFGTVPGAYRRTKSDNTYYDRESIEAAGIPTYEETKDHQTDLHKRLTRPEYVREEHAT